MQDTLFSIRQHVLSLACVPQFDTMHPSMSLGAIFNDRNMTLCSVQLKIKSDSFCTCRTSGSHCRRFSGYRKHNVFVSGFLHLQMGVVVWSVGLHMLVRFADMIFFAVFYKDISCSVKRKGDAIFFTLFIQEFYHHSEVALHLRNFHRLQGRFRAGRWQDIFLNPQEPNIQSSERTLIFAGSLFFFASSNGSQPLRCVFAPLRI